MSSTLHAQVSVLKAGLTWSVVRLMVLLNNHKIWVDGNFRVTFFMVIIFFGGWMENTALKKEQYSIHDTVNNDSTQKQGGYYFHDELHATHIRF